jgi:hypothetical protein
LDRVKISVTTPTENADQIRDALGKAGAGTDGEYTFCSFSVTGQGRFIPSENAKPHIGEGGQLEVVEEERIEVVCDRADARAVIAALKLAHPYEHPAIDIYPLIDPNNL